MHRTGMNPIDPSPSPSRVPELTPLDEEGSIFTVTNFLSPSECEAFIQRTEAVGYEEAPVTTPRGFVRRPELRNNTRVMEDVPALAGLLWERMRRFAVDAVPSSTGGAAPGEPAKPGPSGRSTVGIADHAASLRPGKTTRPATARGTRRPESRTGPRGPAPAEG